MRKKIGSALILALCFNHAGAQEESLEELMSGFETPPTESEETLDSLLEGFEEATPGEVSPAETEPQERSPWRLRGLASVSTAYAYQHVKPARGETDYRGFNRARLKFAPVAEYRWNRLWDAELGVNAYYDLAYELNGRSSYPTNVLHRYERELELRDAFVRGRVTQKLDVKLGRQIVVWGKADSIRVVDVINPLDLREPGMVDIEDLRLPVGMAKLDFYHGSWNFSGMLIPEIRFNKMPPFGSEYYPFPQASPDVKTYHDGLENMELAAAASGRFTGWDISFHFADFLAEDFVVENGTASRPRLRMLGSSYNATQGNWLYKIELAGLNGLRFSQLPQRDFTRLDSLLGIEYYGTNNHTFALETALRHIKDYDSRLDSGLLPTAENEGQVALRFTGNYLREKLEAGLLASLTGLDGADGAFYRAWADYSLAAGLSVLGGVVIYQSGDSVLFEQIARNDRLFAELKYYF